MCDEKTGVVHLNFNKSIIPLQRKIDLQMTPLHP